MSGFDPYPLVFPAKEVWHNKSTWIRYNRIWRYGFLASLVWYGRDCTTPHDSYELFHEMAISQHVDVGVSCFGSCNLCSYPHTHTVHTVHFLTPTGQNQPQFSQNFPEHLGLVDWTRPDWQNCPWLTYSSQGRHMIGTYWNRLKLTNDISGTSVL